MQRFYYPVLPGFPTDIITAWRLWNGCFHCPAFPTLAENVTLGHMDRFRNIIQDTLRTILFLSLPSSLGLIVLGLPIIQVLLEHGAYSLDNALSTSFLSHSSL